MESNYWSGASPHIYEGDFETDALYGTHVDWFVTGQYTGMGPKNYHRPDGSILDELHHWLMLDPYIDASGMEVSVQDGVVTFTGTANDRQAKRRAEDLAWGLRGVRDVVNRTSVRSRL